MRSLVCRPWVWIPHLQLPTSCLTSKSLGSFMSYEYEDQAQAMLVSFVDFKRVKTGRCHWVRSCQKPPGPGFSARHCLLSHLIPPPHFFTSSTSFFFFLPIIFWPCHVTCRILILWPGLKVPSPNHWTSRAFPPSLYSTFNPENPLWFENKSPKTCHCLFQDYLTSETKVLSHH